MENFEKSNFEQEKNEWEIFTPEPEKDENHSLYMRDNNGILIKIQKIAVSSNARGENGESIPGWLIAGMGTGSEDNKFEVGTEYDEETGEDNIIGWGGLSLPKEEEYRKKYYQKNNWPQEAVEAVEKAIENPVYRG